jgi:glycyl-tRNA synthetase beta chain
MPELFIELFSEEIPARMQAEAGAELKRLTVTLAAPLSPTDVRVFWGPRRVALTAIVAPASAAGTMEARGPRDSAPEAALAGFLGKYGAAAQELVKEGGYYWLRRAEPPVPAAQLLAGLGPALAKFSWPKSMRWGQGGDFTWVRPLRGFVVLLDGAVIPTTLGPVASGNMTEGQRVMGPGRFEVSSAAQWEVELKARHVIADQAVRRRFIEEGLARAAAAQNLSVVPDEGLLTEVIGLVEWPVALLGRIGDAFMDLPPEVRELSMKVNQRYFALRDAAGNPAPWFAFVANLEAPDGGAAIVAGNERVLRARLSDAQHFYALDLKTPLDARLPALEAITFHAKIGTQRARAERIAALAEAIATALGADAETAAQAGHAGRLAKADLVTGMVGEFPELQGIMGGYYARHLTAPYDPALVAPAITTHYLPKGPSDPVPAGLVPAAVALADKLDTITRFFAAGERPTGSGDPYALRRAALGVIRIILENELSLPLGAFVESRQDVMDFITERLRVKLRTEGERFDSLDAVLAVRGEDDVRRLMQRFTAVRDFLATPDGANLLTAYRRAANIIKIEDGKDGPHTGAVDQASLVAPEEKALASRLDDVRRATISRLEDQDFAGAMTALSQLRAPVDAFFDAVTVNDTVPQNRRNRLGLLAQLRDTMRQIADFSKIEG